MKLLLPPEMREFLEDCRLGIEELIPLGSRPDLSQKE